MSDTGHRPSKEIKMTKEQIIDEISKFFSDTSRDPQETMDALLEIKEVADDFVSALLDFDE